MKPQDQIRLTQFFLQVRDDYASRDSSVGELLEIFNDRGHGLLLFFLLIPSLQPIPIPGLGSAFGALVALHGLAMIFSWRPRLPKRLSRIPIKSETMRLLCLGCCKVFGLVEKLIRPRWTFFTKNSLFRFINGAIVFIGGVVLALPLMIPLSNFIPALLLFLICLGTLEDDGLMILLGYLYAILLIGVFIFFGPKAIEFIKSLF